MSNNFTLVFDYFRCAFGESLASRLCDHMTGKEISQTGTSRASIYRHTSGECKKFGTHVNIRLVTSTTQRIFQEELLGQFMGLVMMKVHHSQLWECESVTEGIDM